MGDASRPHRPMYAKEDLHDGIAGRVCNFARRETISIPYLTSCSQHQFRRYRGDANSTLTATHETSEYPSRRTSYREGGTAAGSYRPCRHSSDRSRRMYTPTLCRPFCLLFFSVFPVLSCSYKMLLLLPLPRARRQRGRSPADRAWEGTGLPGAAFCMDLALGGRLSGRDVRTS